MKNDLEAELAKRAKKVLARVALAVIAGVFLVWLGVNWNIPIRGEDGVVSLLFLATAVSKIILIIALVVLAGKGIWTLIKWARS